MLSSEQYAVLSTFNRCCLKMTMSAHTTSVVVLTRGRVHKSAFDIMPHWVTARSA